MLYLSLKFVHFIFMSTWMGSSLFAMRDIRTSLAGGTGQVPGLRDRMGRIGKLAMLSGAMTILTGFGLIFALGGFGAVPRGIHIGMTTGILTGIIGGVGVGRTWAQIDAKLGAGADPASLAALVKRIGMFSGIFHGLFFVTLLLMVFRLYVG